MFYYTYIDYYIIKARHFFVHYINTMTKTIYFTY